jgi:hypothetical protein
MKNTQEKRLFHLVNSLVVCTNLWLILLSNIGKFFRFSQMQIKKFLKFSGFKMCIIFLLLCWMLSYEQFCDFSLIKSCKTYLGPMLPPGGRNLQLIYPLSWGSVAKEKKFDNIWHLDGGYVDVGTRERPVTVIRVTDRLSHFKSLRFAWIFPGLFQFFFQLIIRRWLCCDHQKKIELQKSQKHLVASILKFLVRKKIKTFMKYVVKIGTTNRKKSLKPITKFFLS